jgi:hypothetical protein
MSKMLCRDLTFAEQMALASLTQHRGFEVLTKIFDEACVEANQAPIKLDPMIEKYDQKLKMLTLVARLTNDFCASVRNTVTVHISAAVAQQNELEQAELMETEAEDVLNTLRRVQSEE